MELIEKQIENAKRAWHDAAMKKAGLVQVLDPDEIIDVIAPHVQYAQPVVAEQPVDEDVIARMIHAWLMRGGDDPECMTDAAQVLLDALRGPVTPEEYDLWAITPGVCPSLKAVFEYRLDHILKPNPKSADERYTVNGGGISPNRWWVEFDGKIDSEDVCRKSTAELIRLGKIAALKERKA